MRHDTCTSAEIGEGPRTKPCDDDTDAEYIGSFKFTPIAASYVSEQIKAMKSSKATGLDGITCRLLKAASPAIAYSLSYLVNRSLASGVLPKQWPRMAKVTPIFKRGDRNQITNY